MFKHTSEFDSYKRENEMQFDGEALSFVTGFYDTSNRFMTEFLPSYKNTTGKVISSLSTNEASDLYQLIWRTQENGIAHASQGMPSFVQLDALKEDLVDVILAIRSDGSPEQYERTVAQFTRWREQGRINVIPWLLIARAFAAIHPKRYHTTVSHDAQVQVSDWLSRHTNFVPPPTRNWAELAAAITAHLAASHHFDLDPDALALFPWFVVEQVRKKGHEDQFKPGHKPRTGSSDVNHTPTDRTAELRHNLLQTKLFALLEQTYGKGNVGTEQGTGTGGFADALVRLPDGRFILYEIKIAKTAALVVREALGQLLEYGFRSGGLEPGSLVAVGEHGLDEITQQYITRLQKQFGLPLQYMQLSLS